MNQLPLAAREKLASICGMLSSSFDGERANAAAAATNLLHRHGMTWRDLLAPVAVPPRLDEAASGLGNRAAFALRHMDLLTDWECQFIRDVAGRSRLSPKQRMHVARIVAKIRMVRPA